jgi:hypothetical protein
MVAITVILAAVIGAFVLEIGDQQETAPNTSFDSEQRTTFLETTPGSSSNANVSEVRIGHAGGTVLDISQTTLSVNGNRSVYGRWKTAKEDGTINKAQPQPNIFPTLGTNEKVEFSSGQEWKIHMYCGDICMAEPAGHTDNGNRLPLAENLAIPDRNVLYIRTRTNPDHGSLKYIGWGTPDSQGLGYTNIGHGDWLTTGDNVQVVWTASSGGKTQSLFRYTVQ